VELVDPDSARFIHQTYHYLGSYREDGIHLGLYTTLENSRDWSLLSIATLSPFDLSHMIAALPSGIAPEQTMVLSRLFAFNWCPRNTISYMLGRVFEWIKEELPGIKLLVTYLNPNLGFDGSVYKATNWILLGLEKKTAVFVS
jgi:hypothetical protein